MIASLWNLTGILVALLPMCLLNFGAIGKNKPESPSFEISRGLAVRGVTGKWKDAHDLMTYFSTSRVYTLCCQVESRCSPKTTLQLTPSALVTHFVRKIRQTNVKSLVCRCFWIIAENTKKYISVDFATFLYLTIGTRIHGNICFKSHWAVYTPTAFSHGFYPTKVIVVLSLFLMVRMTFNHHWVRLWLDTELETINWASDGPSFFTHMCITRPRWVNKTVMNY